MTSAIPYVDLQRIKVFHNPSLKINMVSLFNSTTVNLPDLTVCGYLKPILLLTLSSCQTLSIDQSGLFSPVY